MRKRYPGWYVYHEKSIKDFKCGYLITGWRFRNEHHINTMSIDHVLLKDLNCQCKRPAIMIRKVKTRSSVSSEQKYYKYIALCSKHKNVKFGMNEKARIKFRIPNRKLLLIT